MAVRVSLQWSGKMRYHVLDAQNNIINIVEANEVFMAINFPHYELGEQNIAVIFPEPPKTVTGVTFLRRFTSSQRIAVQELAKTDPVITDFMFILNAAISSNTPIDLNDIDVVAGVNYITTVTQVTPPIDPQVILA